VIFLQGQLSQKERMLLEDLKKEEDLCVIKYQNYAQQAQDSNLSQLFNKIASEEQKHYDTVNSLLQGSGQGGSSQTVSQMGQSEGLQQSQSGGQMSQASGKVALNRMGSDSSSQMSSGSGSDKYMLHDMLSTEKYVSSAYDTSVFECAQSSVRQALQQIQQDEQNHGEQLYQYMSSHGMYQTQ
jgi:spore coat protein CotF